MNPFYQYLEKQLAEHLQKRRVVVWYDPQSEFASFVDALKIQGKEACGIYKVAIGGMDVSLACYKGSFFGLKATVEPIMAADLPAPMLLYIPGVSRDKDGSILMEIEKAGEFLELKLKSEARFCLRDKYSDGIIDAMLTTEKLTYEDIVEFLSQGGSERPSVLRMVFEGARENHAIAARFLCVPNLDINISKKGASAELFKLFESRLGLSIGPDTPLSDARQKALRHVLVNEFRSDLNCAPPPSVSMIPETRTAEQLELVRKTAQTMREEYPDAYVVLSDNVARELGLANQDVDPNKLGKVDTFRFEEAALLSLAGELIRKGQYDEAAIIVTERKRSFWVDRDLFRQSQWEACRLMAHLGGRILSARKDLKKAPSTPKGWVDAYCADTGWHRVDQIQQALEAWVAKIQEEPENESALETVRQSYEDFLQEMTIGFVESLSENKWATGELNHQTKVYASSVAAEKGPTAYFLVDAMRYAMAAELVELLPTAKDVILKPAIGAWPTITPVGMAALLPGAESGFCIMEDAGKLAARVEGSLLPDVSARMKYLKARVPGMVEMPLEKLLDMSSKKLENAISQSPLVVVRSQEIDALGELAGSLVARQLMDTMVGNVARAIKKIAAVGINRFVVTADHGHLFTRKKEDSFKTDTPVGKALEIHRRCWIGEGGNITTGTVRLTSEQIGYDTDLEFIFPKGIGVFKTGGGLGYHHGGLSLQEMIIPVVTFKMGRETPPGGAEGNIKLSGVPEKITNRTFGLQLELTGLFDTKPLSVRPILLSKGVIVGKAGMAVDADFDQITACVTVEPKRRASVAMILDKDDVAKLQIVIQDPVTDRVLAQSKDIQVELGTR